MVRISQHLAISGITGIHEQNDDKWSKLRQNKNRRGQWSNAFRAASRSKSASRALIAAVINEWSKNGRFNSSPQHSQSKWSRLAMGVEEICCQFEGLMRTTPEHAARGDASWTHLLWFWRGKPIFGSSSRIFLCADSSMSQSSSFPKPFHVLEKLTNPFPVFFIDGRNPGEYSQVLEHVIRTNGARELGDNKSFSSEWKHHGRTNWSFLDIVDKTSTHQQDG